MVSKFGTFEESIGKVSKQKWHFTCHLSIATISNSRYYLQEYLIGATYSRIWDVLLASFGSCLQ